MGDIDCRCRRTLVIRSRSRHLIRFYTLYSIRQPSAATSRCGSVTLGLLREPPRLCKFASGNPYPSRAPGTLFTPLTRFAASRRKAKNERVCFAVTVPRLLLLLLPRPTISFASLEDDACGGDAKDLRRKERLRTGAFDLC